jgi:hypothetical protein
MRLEDQVITFETALKLKALGVSQNSYFSYMGDMTPRLMEGDDKHPTKYGPWIILLTTKPYNNQDGDWRDDVAIKEPFAAAFTVAELGQMLLAYVYRGHSFTPLGTEWYHTWQNSRMESQPVLGPFDTEAQARAGLLIHLLENNLVTAEAVNARLKQ